MNKVSLGTGRPIKMSQSQQVLIIRLVSMCFFYLLCFPLLIFLATLIRNVVQSAMDDFKQFTCIQFTERTTEADYLSFQAENTG